MTKHEKKLDAAKNDETANLISNEDFAKLLDEFEKDSQKILEGTIVKGVIVEIADKNIAVDIGAKSVGYIEASEFKRDGQINEGDVVDVFLKRLENKRGELIISRDHARRLNNWNYLKDCMEAKTIIKGNILGRVKGGYAVDINGITCFLPRSQVDTILITDDEFLIGKDDDFHVLKIDDLRGNVVVSRRSIIEAQRNVEKDKVLATIKVGDAIEGIVKNITDYGAFIDFGSYDGLLHLTDISWCRVRHPSEVLKIGETVKVQVIKFDEASKRISLGMKQLQKNPWESISERYPVGSIAEGRVTNITTYGAFVEIESGIEGLVHVSEMSWLKNASNPNKLMNAGDKVNVMILDVNPQNHRISLGIKQCEKNPWQSFSEAHKIGDVIEGEIKDITDFGIFVEIAPGIEGLVHVSDSAHEGSNEEKLAKFKKGDMTKVILLGANYEKERISLSIKQSDNKSFKDELKAIKEGAIVPCLVTAVKKDFIEIELDMGLKGTIKRLDLSNNKNEQKTDKFEVGDRIEAKITLFNDTTGKLLLSIKDLEEDLKQEHYYSSANSGETIGSIAGDVLGSLSFDKNEEKDVEEVKKAKNTKSKETKETEKEKEDK